MINEIIYNRGGIIEIMRKSFLKFINSMMIAMEADDITGQTANAVRDTLGGTPDTQDEVTSRRDEEDLEKTDDIFGLKEDTPQENNPTTPGSEETEETVPEENNESPTADDPNVSDNQLDENIENEDNLADDQQNNEFLFTKKNNIRDNLVQLYTIVSGDIEIIVNSLTNINDIQTIRVMNIVLNHMRNIKSFIYKTLTSELPTLEYDELLRRYITIKRVYDLCIEMMEKFFKEKKDSK